METKYKPAPSKNLPNGVLVLEDFEENSKSPEYPVYTRYEDLLGRHVFIRTVTMYFIGRVAGYDPDRRTVVLTQASWLASTGKWTDFLVKGLDGIDELEPYPPHLPVIIRDDVVVDWNEWRHPLPTEPITS